MSRPRVVALIAIAILIARLAAAGPVHADDPTPTPTPTLTPTPAWEMLVVLPVSGASLLIERRWSYGEEAIFFAIIGLAALVALGWIFDVARQEAGRQ